MTSRSKGKAGWHAAISAGALATLFAAVLTAGSNGCGFSTNGLGTTTGTGGSTTTATSSGGAGGATSSSSSSGSGGCTVALDCAASTDPCQAVTCQDGKCVGEAVTPGTPCSTGTGVCDTTGACVPCIEDNGTTFGCPATAYCYEASCQSCTDGAKSGDETDVDCGGAHCGKCGDGKQCNGDGDCDDAVMLTCETITHTCASCTNGARDGSESDVDCGGSCAKKCDNGKACAAGSDCASGQCIDGLCCDVACSGSCASCNLPGRVGTCTKVPEGVDGSPSCGTLMICDGMGACEGTNLKKPVGQPCGGNSECVNNNCKLGACRLKQGDYCSNDIECETNRCSNHQCVKCNNDGDCGASGHCQSSNFCKLPSYATCSMDGDCLINKCYSGHCTQSAPMAPCSSEADCATHFCSGGKCANCTNNGDCASNSCLGTACVPPSGEYCNSSLDCPLSTCVPSPLFGKCQ